ncbi:SAM-dependent chlorinase/fluorinase [Flavobacteriaceae bacterium]|nr:SAM-dependent chlorinase/fluorinase [Flavobacteriaceae bacterium]
MAIITLTTDFGLKDHYVAAVKGAIYSEIPEITIVDVSHKVTPFNYNEASYIIKNTYQNFPKGTIHIIGVDSEVSTENQHIAMLLDGHYFICANNGILSVLNTTKHPEKIIEITTHQQINDNFPVKNVFTKIACHLARGGNLDVIGRPFNGLKEVTNVMPVVNPNKSMIIGHVQYIDNYGNIISNITKELIISIAQGRKVNVTIRSFVFENINNSYGDFINYNIPKEKRNVDGKRIALYNSNNYLEIALYKSSLETSGGASTLLGINSRDTISITFID